MSTETHTTVHRATPAAARLTTLAGWSMVAIALLHTAVFIPQIPWGEWLDGGLRAAEPDMESVALFWALPGGIVVPALLLGMFIVRFGGEGRRVGLAVTAALTAWALGCLWLVGPSGFMFVLVTSGLLTAAAVFDRPSCRRAPTSD